MARPTQPAAEVSNRQHKRTTSAVLKSIVTPRAQKNTSARDQSASPTKTKITQALSQSPTKLLPAFSLPSDHPHTNIPLGEINFNRERVRSPPGGAIEIFDESKHQPSMLHKRTKSAVSLKSLSGKSKEKEKGEKTKPAEIEKRPRPQKSKSSTGLSALLSRQKGSKSTDKVNELSTKDKENQTPPNTGGNSQPPPIWSQFASQGTEEITRTTKIPLNDTWDLEDECSLYSPQMYSPSKSRNFFNEPTLAKKPETKQRPKSVTEGLSSSSTSLFETFSHRRKNSTSSGQNGGKKEAETNARKEEAKMQDAPNGLPNSLEDSGKPKSDASKSGTTMGKRGTRVMAAVAAWNGKAKEPAFEPKETKLDPAAVEKAFETMLVS